MKVFDLYPVEWAPGEKKAAYKRDVIERLVDRIVDEGEPIALGIRKFDLGDILEDAESMLGTSFARTIAMLCVYGSEHDYQMDRIKNQARAIVKHWLESDEWGKEIVRERINDREED